MNLTEYQEWTKTTAVYSGLVYPQLALAEEVGEFLGKIAKFHRDRTDIDVLRQDLKKEGGDILWQLARVLDDFGIRMQDCLDGNVEKLESRKNRGVLQGSGDNR